MVSTLLGDKRCASWTANVGRNSPSLSYQWLQSISIKHRSCSIYHRFSSRRSTPTTAACTTRAELQCNWHKSQLTLQFAEPFGTVRLVCSRQWRAASVATVEPLQKYAAGAQCSTTTQYRVESLMKSRSEASAQVLGKDRAVTSHLAKDLAVRHGEFAEQVPSLPVPSSSKDVLAQQQSGLAALSDCSSSAERSSAELSGGSIAASAMGVMTALAEEAELLEPRGVSGKLGQKDVSSTELERRAKISRANKGKASWNEGKKHSPETLRRIREGTLRAMKRPEVIEKLKVHHRPLRHSAETKAKISAAVMKRKANNRWLAELSPSPRRRRKTVVQATARASPQVGQALPEVSSPATKAGAEGSGPKPLSRCGPRPEEHCRAISEAIKRKWQDPEYRARAAAGKRVEHSARASQRKRQPAEIKAASQGGAGQWRVAKKPQPRMKQVAARRPKLTAREVTKDDPALSGEQTHSGDFLEEKIARLQAAKAETSEDGGGKGAEAPKPNTAPLKPQAESGNRQVTSRVQTKAVKPKPILEDAARLSRQEKRAQKLDIAQRLVAEMEAALADLRDNDGVMTSDENVRASVAEARELLARAKAQVARLQKYPSKDASKIDHINGNSSDGLSSLEDAILVLGGPLGAPVHEA